MQAMTNRRDFIKATTLSTIAGAQLLRYHGALGETTIGDLPSAATNPFLSGGFAPVQDELTVDNLLVKGEVPREIAGIYMRNGPNPAYPPISYFYPFDGDGMIHALYFEDGRVSYRNRFVNTAGLKAERRAGHAIYGGLFKPIRPDPAFVPPDGDPSPFKKVANTNVIAHAGRFLALREDDLPYEITRDLDTAGKWNFYGGVEDAVTAHPKIDPATGELFMFRYSLKPPYLVLRVVDPSGRLSRDVPLDVPAAFIVHDMAITTDHVVFFLCPFVGEFAPGQPHVPSFSWKPELGTQIAVVERNGSGQIRRFTTDPFFMFHFMNAYDTDHGIATEYCEHQSLFSRTPASLWRMTLDFATGSARREQIDDRPSEFPRVDPRVCGRQYRYGWSPVAIQQKRAPGTWSALARFDFKTDAIAVHDFGPGHEVDEPVFVARPGSHDEGDGWIMAYVYDTASDNSSFVILEATDLDKAPIAEIALPRRVPHGFHGNWMPAA
jgi:carotenoid cleavage dioxygenase-like enzyme